MNTSSGVLLIQTSVWKPKRIPQECQWDLRHFGVADVVDILLFRPPWKLFAFTFWGSKPYNQKFHSKSDPYSFNPLGSEWNIVSVLKFIFAYCCSLKLNSGHTKYVFCKLQFSLLNDYLDAREAVLHVCDFLLLCRFLTDSLTGAIIFKVASRRNIFHTKNVKMKLSCSLNVRFPAFLNPEIHTETWCSV